MAEDRKPAALAALQGVVVVVGAVATLSGIVSSSVVAAVNTVGVVGVGALVIGGGVWWEYSDGDQAGRVRATCWAVGLTAAILGLLNALGRPLDEDERAPNLLTVIGVISIFGLALLVTLAWREIQASSEPERKKCPDCANLVLAEARKCQHCGFVFPS